MTDGEKEDGAFEFQLAITQRRHCSDTFWANEGSHMCDGIVRSPTPVTLYTQARRKQDGKIGTFRHLGQVTSKNYYSVYILYQSRLYIQNTVYDGRPTKIMPSSSSVSVPFSLDTADEPNEDAIDILDPDVGSRIWSEIIEGSGYTVGGDDSSSSKFRVGFNESCDVFSSIFCSGRPGRTIDISCKASSI